MSDINFPPVESLTLRAGISVMVVMPPLSEGDERENEAILTVITRFESSLAHDVRKRVDAECAVIQQGSADTETPREHLERRCAERRVVGLERVAQPRHTRP